MHRSRSSLPYDILHGIQFPTNLSVMFAYLSYFPPPPPVMPGPPPRRSWTCSSRSLSLSSCFASDYRNPLSVPPYIPLIGDNQSTSLANQSHITINSSNNIKSSSLTASLIDLFKNQFTLILLLIIVLSIIIFLIFFFILFLYIQRHRQRQLTLNNHSELNDKNKKFYYRLIPHRRKHQTTATTTSNNNINNTNENNLIRLRNHNQHHDSPTAQVIRISIANRLHTNANNETEEAV